MPKIPGIKPKNLLKMLKKKGFFIHHQVGSHIVLKHETDATRRVTLPMHNTDLKKGTLGSVLKQAGLNREDISSSS